ncbi:LacI family DNA-binding transcriptional regulator [Streptomyces sp. GC420]|uniref:LacI family DNA-binding transcriptional regulator n=1 Tax=Streptomyces sp. GC420 TaxID=2697568 RepID=UPI00141516A3|nr:LacI family DNA-binding transcriptional regulator [Streptomyces sp. GC420]NBM15479.1 substrate-binding domain-containing protein [Streptomyces sp. GC420]
MNRTPEPPMRARVTERAAPTSADVARLAGVSRATVSYVLNDTEAVRISEATRHRVRAAAEELGYVPHAAARSLRAGSTRMVLLPGAHIPLGPLYGRFLAELQWALRRLDYTVVQYGTIGMSGDEAARAWAELRPVAVLSFGEPGLTAHGVEILKRSGARAVVTLGPEPVEGARLLHADQAAIGRCALEHLVERGRRRIGVVVPQEPGLEVFSAPRLAGAREVADRSGVFIEPLPLAYEEEPASLAARRAREIGLDAVFAYNDEYAALLMRALCDEGVGVPGDIAVMGADDLLLGRLQRPRLSTVHLDLVTGEALASLVDTAVRDSSADLGSTTLMTAYAVRRAST